MARRRVVCDFCHLSEENQKTGPMLNRNNVMAHENCLLYSSGIYSKNTPDVDDLYGIDDQDIIKEIKRGRKLKCHKCKKTGATIGCELGKCKKSYHYLCALTDGAHTTEDITNGVFRLYCKAHRSSLDKEETSAAEEVERGGEIEDSTEEIPSKKLEFQMTLPPAHSLLIQRTKTSTPRRHAKGRSVQWDSSASSKSETSAAEVERGGEIEDSTEEIPSKRTKRSTPKRHAKRRSVQWDSSASSKSGRRQEFLLEQGPVETDSEDDANSGQNVAAEADDNRDDDPDCTQLDRNVDADKPRASTSGNQVTSNRKLSDTGAENCSESLLLPLKITGVQSICSPIPGFSHNTQVSSVECSFWAKCQEAGCIESVFSTIISSMKGLSERMISKQASEEDCILSFKVLKASGMLPDILAQIEQDMNGKLKTLQEETESLQTALTAIGSASKLCSSKETIKPEMSQK